jgi:hypothetical protein
MKDVPICAESAIAITRLTKAVDAPKPSDHDFFGSRQGINKSRETYRFLCLTIRRRKQP